MNKQVQWALLVAKIESYTPETSVMEMDMSWDVPHQSMWYKGVRSGVYRCIGHTISSETSRLHYTGLVDLQQSRFRAVTPFEDHRQ